MYAGIYIETAMNNTHSLLVFDQIEIIKGNMTPLLQSLKQLLMDGFTNSLSKYNSQSIEIGVYVSNNSFNTFTNYSPDSFFSIVKFSTILKIIDDSSIPNIDSPYKIIFNHTETRLIFNNDTTISSICDIEADYLESTKTRLDTIKFLKKIKPEVTVKWYNMTRTIKIICRRHIRRKIINILAKDIKGYKEQLNTKHESIV